MSKSCLVAGFWGRPLCCLSIHSALLVLYLPRFPIKYIGPTGPPARMPGSDRRAGYPVSRIVESVQGGGNISRPSPRTHLQNPTFYKTTRIEGAARTVPRGLRKHALFSQGTKRPCDRGFTVGYWHLESSALHHLFPFRMVLTWITSIVADFHGSGLGR